MSRVCDSSLAGEYRAEERATCQKRGIDGVKESLGSMVVEIGANRQSCDPSLRLLFKQVLEVVLGVASRMHERGFARREHSIPHKSTGQRE